MSGSSKSPSGCSEDKIPPSPDKDDVSTPVAEPQSLNSTSPVSGEQSSSVSLTDSSREETTSSRGRDSDVSDEASDQTGRIQRTFSPPITAVVPQNVETSSNVESAVILNSGNQSNGSDTTDLTKEIPLESIRSEPTSSSKPGPYINRDPCSTYKRYADVSSPEEVPPRMNVTAEIHEPPQPVTEVRPRQSRTISRPEIGTSSGIEIPDSSQQNPQSENPPARRVGRPEEDIIHFFRSPVNPSARREEDIIHIFRSPVSSPIPSDILDSKPSLAEKVQKAYVILEPLFLILICSLFFGILLPIMHESDRTREIGLPSYPYSLGSSICIYRQFYRTLNCLQINETEYLTRNFIRKDCLYHLKHLFREEFCVKNSSSPNLLYGTYSRSIDGTYFFRNLTGSDDTLNADNVLKYMTCVRVFEKNPFGEVKVVARANETEESIIRYNFVLKNYKLMTECKIIPSDSLFDYFKDQRRVYSFVTWVFSIASLLGLIFTLVRFHRNAKAKAPRPTATLVPTSTVELTSWSSPETSFPPVTYSPPPENLPPPEYEDTAL